MSPSLKLTTSNNYLDFCEFIQKELEKLGIEIIIDVIPGSALKQAKANGKLDFFRASWIADYPDAENYLSLFYSKNFAPNGPNYTHFSDYEYDKIEITLAGASGSDPNNLGSCNAQGGNGDVMVLSVSNPVNGFSAYYETGT